MNNKEAELQRIQRMAQTFGLNPTVEQMKILHSAMTRFLAEFK